MKLNPDCIRDILIYVEENTSYKRACCIEPSSCSKSFPDYSPEELLYHVDQCDMSGYFSKTSHDLSNNVTIAGLSPLGHQFIDNVRSETVWNDVKQVSATVGSKSLSALSQIASGVITSLIEHQLGLR